MSKNYENKVRNFEERYTKLDSKIYNSLISEIKRVVKFKKSFRINNTKEFKELILLCFPNIIKSDLIPGNFIEFKNNFMKITFLDENEIEITQVSDDEIIRTSIIRKKNKIIYSNTIKSKEPFQADHLKGSLNKRFFKKQFKLKFKVFKKTIDI